jgi:hypothetical protein
MAKENQQGGTRATFPLKSWRRWLSWEEGEEEEASVDQSERTASICWSGWTGWDNLLHNCLMPLWFYQYFGVICTISNHIHNDQPFNMSNRLIYATLPAKLYFMLSAWRFLNWLPPPTLAATSTATGTIQRHGEDDSTPGLCNKERRPRPSQTCQSRGGIVVVEPRGVGLVQRLEFQVGISCARLRAWTGCFYRW